MTLEIYFDQLTGQQGAREIKVNVMGDKVSNERRKKHREDAGREPGPKRPPPTAPGDRPPPASPWHRGLCVAFLRRREGCRFGAGCQYLHQDRQAPVKHPVNARQLCPQCLCWGHVGPVHYLSQSVMVSNCPYEKTEAWISRTMATLGLDVPRPGGN